MKKYIAIGCIWFAVLTLQVSSQSQSLSYRIHYDSNTQNTYEIKQAVIEQYQDLTYGVHNESVVTMISNNLNRFEVQQDVKAVWDEHQLQIIEGDGLGVEISGDLDAQSICIPEVKPKSLIAEWLGL